MDADPSKTAPIMSSRTFELCESVLFFAVLTVSLLGVVTNAINIRVFMWQGVTSDNTTSAMFALAVSNLLGSITIIPKALCFYVDKFATMSTTYIPDSCYTWTDVTAAYMHIMFSRVTCWIIVYVSIERTLCVLAPLSVKHFLKPKTTMFVMCAIYIFYFIFHIPFIVNVRITVHNANAAGNETMKAVFEETRLGKLFLQINNMLGNMFLTTVAMVIIAVTTVVMLLRLKSSRKWRNSLVSAKVNTNTLLSSKSTLTSSAYKMSRKDREVVKIVSTVTSIYLMCLGSSHVPGSCILFIPGMNSTGTNSSLFHLTYTLKYLLDGVNSAVNFFFYIRLSSKYRAAIYEMFCVNKQTAAHALLANIQTIREMHIFMLRLDKGGLPTKQPSEISK